MDWIGEYREGVRGEKTVEVVNGEVCRYGTKTVVLMYLK